MAPERSHDRKTIVTAASVSSSIMPRVINADWPVQLEYRIFGDVNALLFFSVRGLWFSLGTGESGRNAVGFDEANGPCTLLDVDDHLLSASNGKRLHLCGDLWFTGRPVNGWRIVKKRFANFDMGRLSLDV